MSFIHNRQELETAQMSIKQQRLTQCTVFMQ